jgi:hypothetical protein
MRHLDSLLNRHPHLRHVDYQRLVQRAKADPPAVWDELVEVSIPIVYTAALRLADDLRNGPGIAEEATREVFARIRRDDYAVIRDYVGMGKWPSLLVRLTEQTRLLSERRREREHPADPATCTEHDPDFPIPPLDDAVARRFEAEGERFLTAMRKSMGILHRNDRLLLGMRYEQGCSLRELDRIFRLGSAQRVESLLERLLDSLQPLRAVCDAWGVSREQKHALMRAIVGRVFGAGSMETDEQREIAPALQHR